MAMHQALERIAGCGCHFLVFGRFGPAGFVRLGDLELPPVLHRISMDVSAEQFREDIRPRSFAARRTIRGIVFRLIPRILGRVGSQKGSLTLLTIVLSRLYGRFAAYHLPLLLVLVGPQPQGLAKLSSLRLVG